MLVNGKEMPGLTAAQVLAMIKPEEIERVDVQTLPSVRHASSGVDGVIDLIVRRKVKSNTSGQLNAGIGSAGSHLMGVLNQLLGKAWSLTLNTGNLIGYSRMGTRIELIRNEQDTISLTEKGWSIGGYLSGGFTVARSTPNHQLDFGAWGYYNTIRNSTKGTLSSSTTVQEAKMREENTSYLVGGSYSYSGRRNLKINLTSYGTFIPLYREYSRDAISAKSEQGILGYMCDVDAAWRILRQLTLESGGNYRYSRFLASQRISAQTVALERRATVFTSIDYSPWTKLGLTVGGHYAYNAVMPLADEWHHPHSFLLDAAVALRFSYRNTLTLQYSRSNEAPSYGQLTPQSSYPSIFLCVAGNPDLQHGLLQQGELTWSYFTTWHYVRLSAYYKHVEDPVAQVTTLTANALQAQYTNIDASTLVGGDAWLTLKFFHGDLTLQLGGGMQQTTLSFGERKGKGLEWYCSFNGTYSFSKHWLLTLFGTYQSPRVRLEGRESLYWNSNLSLYRSFLEDKLRLAISGDNLFTYPMRVAQTIVSNDFSYSKQTDYYNMGARLLLVWRFEIKSLQHEQGAAKDVYNRGL